MQDSGFKEKKDNSGIFKNPLNFVKNLYGRKSEKGPGAEVSRAPQMTQQQKELLLRNKYPSDEDPLDPTLRRVTTHASTSSTGTEVHNFSGNSQEPKFIKLSSGTVVDNVHNRTQYQPPSFYDHSPSPPRGPPPASFWNNPSSEGYGYRGGYGGGGSTGEYGSSFGSSRQDQRRLPGELDHEEASYETLLKEASMLREDLESEQNRHRGTKEEFKNKMTQTKQRIATAKAQQRLDPSYDNDIILLLSQELTVLEKKIKDMEARITPLDNTIDDIKGVERFIKDRELDSQQASMLFENIMKKMFDDLSVSGHVLTGEATHNFGMPRNVLDELQDKMLKSALKKSDPTRIGSAGDNQGLDWMEFDTEEERVTKISTSDSHEEALRKKRKELAREKFARVSRKLDQVVEFSQKRNKTQFQRAAAFRFNAVDRADAFKDVNYFAAPDLTIQEEDEESVISKSATSDVSRTEALQSLDESVWLGLNTAPVEHSPVPVKQQGIPNATSVGNVKDLEAFPETKIDLTVSGDGQDSKKESPVLADSGLGPAAWTGAQPPPLPLPPGTETAGFKLNIDLDFGQGGGGGQGTTSGGPKTGQENSTQKTKPEGKTEETGSLTDALNEVKLQKTEKTGSGSGTGVTTDLDVSSKTGQGGSDLGNLGLKITGDIPPEDKPKTEVKTEIKVEEKPHPSKPKAPPPPPKKKGAPPPPPGKKKPGPKGGPPPPPGGRKKANDGLIRAPEVIAMFQEMRKALLGNAAKGGGGPKKIGGGAAADPGALMDELSKNSKYAAQVQADIEHYGDIIQGLITQVSTFEPKDMPEMIEFVVKVDGVLSELSDETAVLKKFDWPQRYYTMLEAKGLYTELEKMKQTFSPWKKTENKAVAEMQKIQKFVDKSKTRVDVIMRTKDSDEKKFKENKIPWNAKIFTEVKIASLSPLVAYMEVALAEVDNLMAAAPAEEGPKRKKALDKSFEHLNGTITFAFKVHQFTGGYTKECNLKFAEISKKIAEIRGEIEAIAS